MGHGQKSGQKEVPPGGRKQCSAIKKAFAPCECTHDCIKNMCPAIADVRLRIDGSKGSAACKKMIRRLNQGMNSRTPSAKERRHITHTEGGKKTRAGPDIVHPARPLPPCYYDKSKSYESAYQKNSRLLRIAVLLVNCA